MTEQNNNNGNVVDQWNKLEGPFRGRGGLRECVAELQRQVESAADFVADTRDMEFSMGEKPGTLNLCRANSNLQDFLPAEGIPLLDQALVQVAQKAPIPGAGKDQKRNAGIPIRFFRAALAEHPQRTIDFLNGILHDGPKRRLVRMLDGEVRAVLSDQYRVIDSLAVAKMTLAALERANGRVLEAALSDSHFRLKCVAPEIFDAVDRGRDDGTNPGWSAGGLGSAEYLGRVSAKTMGDLPLQAGRDTVWPIVTVSNSETGHGGFSGGGGILMAVCYNLATVEQRVTEVHLGRRLETGLFKRDTVEAEAAAIHCRVRDQIDAYFTEETFRKIVDGVRAQAERRVESPSAAVNFLVGESTALGDADLDALLDRFGEQPGERSVFNLAQAVARHAQDVKDPERADGLERLAGEVMRGKHNRELAAVGV